jgi:uncharacterized protein (TIGR03083 family)
MSNPLVQPTRQRRAADQKRSALRAQKKEAQGMETATHLVQVLHGEVERLTQYLRTLPPSAWHHPSACDLWEVRDVVAHLTWVAQRFHGTVSRALRGDSAPPAGAPPVGTSTRAGRNAFVAREAVALRERLGDHLLPTFRAQVDQLIALLTPLSPSEWAQPAYSALRVVPLSHYPFLTLAEVALHAWDMRSRLDPVAPLSLESVSALLQQLPPRLAWGGAGGMASGQGADVSLPGRYRWEVSQVVPSRYDIVGEDGAYRIAPASEAAADVTCRGEAETFVLLLYGRLTLEAALATDRLVTEGEPERVAAFARWLTGV